MPKKLDLTDNLENYIINHSENLTDVQKDIVCLLYTSPSPRD